MDTFENTFPNRENPAEDNRFVPREPAAPAEYIPDPSHVFMPRIPQEQPVYAAPPRIPEPAPQEQPVYAASSQIPEPDTEELPVRKPVRREPKKSPFADSPYVCMPRQPEPVYYVPRQKPDPKEPRKKSRFWSRTLAAVLVLALVAAGCGITALAMDNYWTRKTAIAAEQTNSQLQAMQEQIDALKNQPASQNIPTGPVSYSEGMSPSQVYAQNAASVVSVNVQVSTPYGQGTSSGSGFILTQDGYVVTNHHVVEGAASVTVSTADGKTLEAAVVGYDSPNDIAVLKVEGLGLPAVRIGSSSSVNVGDMVVAIGNPLGELNSTQTVGYICGKDREITTGGTIINMLQTDAAINPGNSGGPLFNMAGEVIGITTAKYSGTTTSGASIEGIGFAIPIDDVMGIINDLQVYGYVTGAYLGITVQNVDSSVSEIYGITGAYVVGVEPGYAAQRAGIQAKDLIIGLDGKEIKSITDLTRGLRSYKAGDTVIITLIRNGIRMDVTVTLDEKPQDLNQTVPQEEETPPEGNYDEWYDFFFGK